MFWFLYAGSLLIIWSYPARIRLLGDNAVLEIVASFLCDLVWIPPALFLPLYLAAAFSKVTNWAVAKVVIVISGFVLLAFGVYFLPHYFNYLIYLIVPFFAFLIYLATFKKQASLHSLAFALVMVLIINHYGMMLLPEMSWGRSKDSMTILTYNIHGRGEEQQREEIARIAKKERPDFVFVQEISSADRKILRSLMESDYPHQLWADRFENYTGGVIFSRIPFVYADNINIKNSITKSHTNMNHVKVDWQGREIHLFNVHLTHGAAPLIRFLVGRKSYDELASETGRAHRRHLDEAQEIIRRVMSVDGPIILAGDMNASPNGFLYHEYCRYLDNSFASAGWGLGGTFGYASLAGNLPQPLRRLLFDFLRIDHLFCSPHFNVESATVLPYAASDHRPLLVRISLR